MKKKGQQAIVGLLMGFVLIAMFAIMLAPMIEFINIGVNASVGSSHSGIIQTTLNIIPVFMALMVLVAVILLITGQR